MNKITQTIENKFWNNCISLGLGEHKGFSNFTTCLGFDNLEAKHFKDYILPELIQSNLIWKRDPKGVIKKQGITIIDFTTVYYFTNDGIKKISETWEKNLTSRPPMKKSSINQKVIINGNGNTLGNIEMNSAIEKECMEEYTPKDVDIIKQNPSLISKILSQAKEFGAEAVGTAISKMLPK